MTKTLFWKWAILLVVLLAAVGSYLIYQRFADEKSAAGTDLMRLIPDNCDAFFSIDQFEHLKDVEQSSLVQSVLQSKNNPSILKTLHKLRPVLEKEDWKSTESHLHQLIISFHSWENSRAELLLFKMAAGDKEKIGKILETHFKSSFTPLEESNAGIDITHYYVSTGIKFHCFFYKGIFACSFNNRLIDETVLRLKNGIKPENEPDFIDIAEESKPAAPFRFFIHLDGIPLYYGNKPNLVDTLNLTGWIAPEISFGQDITTIKYATSPLFESKNQLSLLIGQTPGRPLNPATISEKCSFCIHFGLSDLERFSQNQQRLFGNEQLDSAYYGSQSLFPDSIFMHHFDSEINIAYYPVYLPEREYQKVIVARITDESSCMEKLTRLYKARDIDAEERLQNKSNMIALPQSVITSVFGKTFAVEGQMVYIDLYQNYLVAASRPETVKNYLADLKSEDNISDKIWYTEISGEIDSKSNLYFIGRGNCFIEDKYILPLGLPKFLTENEFLFRNNVFCFQFNAEESFINSYSVIKHLKR